MRPPAKPFDARTDLVLVCGAGGEASDAELDGLLGAGAREIYVGYAPAEWTDRFGLEISPNRRYEAATQIRDRRSLRRAARRVRDAGAGFAVAFNEHVYPPEARALLLRLADEALDAGATALIVADPSLFEPLSLRLPPGGELVASCEAGLVNADAALAAAVLGATRLTLARETELDEARSIAGALARMPVGLEAFVAREYCLNSSAFCHVVHGNGFRTHFCCLPERRVLRDVRDGSERELSKTPAGWHQSPAYLRAALTLHRCGLCAIAPLAAAGVRYLKIPGRSSNAAEAVALVRRLLDGGDLSVEVCRRLVDCEEFCGSGENCYYELAPRPPARIVETAAPRVSGASSPAAPAPERELSVYLPLGGYAPDLPVRLRACGAGAALDDVGRHAAAEREPAARALEALERRGVVQPTRIHLGLECCGLRLPTTRVLARAVKSLRDEGFAVSVVMPVMFEALRPGVLALLAALARQAPDTEVVANDPGLLLLASEEWPGPRAVGRIFHRMKRDVFASDDDVLPALGGDPFAKGPRAKRERLRETQRRAFGHPYLGDEWYRTLLARARVARIGSDVLPSPLSKAPDPEPRWDVYLPWTYVTSTRECPVAAAVEGAPLSHPTRTCKRPCDRHRLVPSYPWNHRFTVQSGAATFVDASREVDAFVESVGGALGRLVFEPFVPV